jgi:hypothetical protein
VYRTANDRRSSIARHDLPQRRTPDAGALKGHAAHNHGLLKIPYSSCHCCQQHAAAETTSPGAYARIATSLLFGHVVLTPWLMPPVNSANSRTQVHTPPVCTHAVVTNC